MPEVIVIFFIFWICVALYLQWDTSRSVMCPECPHCRDKLSRLKEKSKLQRHQDYHYWDRKKVEDCDDPHCKGRS